MPNLPEILGVLLVVFLIWLFIKVASVVIRLILVFVAILVIAGGVWWLFMR